VLQVIRTSNAYRFIDPALEAAGLLAWVNRITRIRRQERDLLGSRHRRGAGFTLSGRTKNIMRHEP
jgi:hypothetical protein